MPHIVSGRSAHNFYMQAPNIFIIPHGISLTSLENVTEALFNNLGEDYKHQDKENVTILDNILSDRACCSPISQCWCHPGLCHAFVWWALPYHHSRVIWNHQAFCRSQTGFLNMSLKNKLMGANYLLVSIEHV